MEPSASSRTRLCFSATSWSHRPFVWDNKRLWQYEADYHARSTLLPAKVFTAVGSDDAPTVREPWAEFNRLIESRHYGGLRWITQMYPEESHISVLPGALSRGIRRVYEK